MTSQLASSVSRPRLAIANVSHKLCRNPVACRAAACQHFSNAAQTKQRSSNACIVKSVAPTKSRDWRLHAAAEEDVIDVEGKEIDDRIPVTVSSLISCKNVYKICRCSIEI